MGKSLLRAVLENPADDTARLVYADWLEEHDHPKRAELIRVQCELAGTSWLTEIRKDALTRRERELLPTFVSLWAVLRPTFTRGFISHVTCTVEKWLEFKDDLLACHPVERVDLIDEPPGMRFPVECVVKDGELWRAPRE